MQWWIPMSRQEIIPHMSLTTQALSKAVAGGPSVGYMLLAIRVVHAHFSQCPRWDAEGCPLP